MKKVILLLCVTILSACTPQVTVTSEVTVTLTLLPTEAPIPTPTLHPQFIELQNFINASGERFNLNPDGTIEEATADGGRQTVPYLHVDQNGIINIIFNNEHVLIEPSQVTFDDENGLTIEGYEQNEDNGEWMEAVSPAMTMATDLLNQYSVDPETVTVTEEGSVVHVTDNETGKVLIRSNGIQSWFEIGFAADTIAANSCESTPFKPNRYGFMPGEYGLASSEYLTSLLGDIKYNGGGGKIFPVLLDEEEQCWAFADSKYLLYRDKDSVAHKLPLIAFTEEEKAKFLESRANK